MLVYSFLEYLFIQFYFWLWWASVPRGLSLTLSRGATVRCSEQAACGGFSCRGAQALGIGLQ